MGSPTRLPASRKPQPILTVTLILLLTDLTRPSPRARRAGPGQPRPCLLQRLGLGALDAGEFLEALDECGAAALDRPGLGWRLPPFRGPGGRVWRSPVVCCSMRVSPTTAPAVQHAAQPSKPRAKRDLCLAHGTGSTSTSRSVHMARLVAYSRKHIGLAMSIASGPARCHSTRICARTPDSAGRPASTVAPRRRSDLRRCVRIRSRCAPV
jgi:hypothetical protein